ncbi:DUF262 domain-containing protein [Psychrobacter sp. 1U2]|uniref:DUF262 domain-containing protein n=1 Tax=Psychrobacter sp. 1U2 TaxID=3453577 RepID=UPI003F473D8F
MYEIYSESAKTLTDSSNIRLPRFQRKQTWNDKKNFALCISIFNNFPIGMFVLNEEILKTKDGQIPTRWLLDGRQRRNALLELYDNPENIYIWAKKFIKFRKTDSADEIEIKFWEAIERHLESDTDDDDEKSVSSELSITDNDLSIDEDDYDDPNVGLDNPTQEFVKVIEDNGVEARYHARLNLLLKIILMCHKVEPKYSGYSRVFDFSKYFMTIDYVVNDSEGQKKVDGSILTTFITSFLSYLDKNSIDDLKEDDFYEFLINRYTLDSSFTEDSLAKYISTNWERLKYRIFIVKQLISQLSRTKIGIIELTKSTSSDAQNIFKLINSSGTTLTAVEILSAKPSWNKKIENPSTDFDDAVTELYETLGVKRQGIVLWDYPATFLERLVDLDFVFPKLNYDKDSQFKSKVTLGFKLLAAIFEGGVTKDKISNLSRSKKINWNEIDKVLNELNTMGKFLNSSPLFQYLKDWDTTLFDLTSEAICLNFVVLIYKNWKDKDISIANSNSAQASSFMNETHALFDRMIYEYTLKQWRGSSDSKIADNINHFKNGTSLKEIGGNKWVNLLNELIDKGTIQDQEASQKDLTGIIYYYYVLAQKSAPKGESIEVDHIISQYHFKSSTGSNSRKLNNLCNFCLLSQKMNNLKRNRSLNEIYHLANTSADFKRLAQDLSYSTDINIDDFVRFSTAQNFDELVKFRKSYFIDAFSKNREQFLN